MIPTEHETTVAVDAAAHAYYAAADNAYELPPWDSLHPIDQLAVRSAVLPYVVAALDALPDRSRCGLCLQSMDNHTVATRRIGRGLDVEAIGWTCPNQGRS